MGEIEGQKNPKIKPKKIINVAFVTGFTLDAPSKHLFPN